MAQSGQEKVSDLELLARKGNLRGLLWRLKLGVLPISRSPMEEVRRAVADGRRKYALLRRRLLVDPHSTTALHKSHLAKTDDPLSQDPDSVWSRYFQISDLEEIIDNDLVRLYPEHGGFFHNPPCQLMLRRILLVWSLMHPSYSYRQGMHELLAPLLYVIHCDLVHLVEFKQRHEDLFDDGFEEVFSSQLQRHESGGNQKTKSLMFFETMSTIECSGIEESSIKRGVGLDFGSPQHVHGLNSVLQIIVMGNDMYGVEGELGVLLSEKFMEHDAFSIFNALMTNESGGVKMADYFLAPNGALSMSGLSPVQEASSLLYKALASVDMPLYGHLKGLGVEPQFFGLRWFRILFGREVSLQKLLILWNAIFSVGESSGAITLHSEGSIDGWHGAPRRVFILALAASMLLYLRPGLLAAHNAAGCLQKLMNFPHHVQVEILIERSVKLIPVMEKTIYLFLNGEKANGTGQFRTLPYNAVYHPLSASSPPLSEFYWEEKWKSSVLQKVNQVKDQRRPEARRDSSHSNVQKGERNHRTVARVLESKRVPMSGGKDGRQGNGKVVADNRNGERHQVAVRDVDAPTTALRCHTALSGHPQDDGCQEQTVGYAFLEQSSCLSASCSEADIHMSSPNKTVKSGLHPRKYWLWSFGKRRNQGVKREEASSLSETSDRPIKDATLEDPPADTMCHLESEEPDSRKSTSSGDVCLNGSGEQDNVSQINSCDAVLVRSVAKNLDLVHAVERSGQVTELRTLGCLIRDKIQVIEAVISEVFVSEIENGERLESPETVRAAFKQLRKISDQLLQM